jgi:hypothetical protein
MSLVNVRSQNRGDLLLLFAKKLLPHYVSGGKKGELRNEFVCK